MKRLSKTFYQKPATELAPLLLGHILIRKIGSQVLMGKIVETEAYSGLEDKASHAYGGLRNRNAPMFEEAGTMYVYFTYGSCYCFNVVCGQKGIPDAVLIRAVEPLQGEKLMVQHRQGKSGKLLCNGPGKLCQAFAIDKKLNNQSLLSHADISLIKGDFVAQNQIVLASRIGLSDRVGVWRDKPLRFYIKENKYVSKK